MEQHEFTGRHEFRPGEMVRVKSEAQILATLDASGRLDGLPFMPEMLAHCGRTARVYKRADKTCDTIGPGGHRRMHGTVHLEGLRCGGEAHDGCQASCLIFWREDWLEPASVTEGGPSPADPADAVAVGSRPRRDGAFSHDDLLRATRIDGREPGGEPVYSCQATEVVRASDPLPWWDLRQYVRDVRSGNFGATEVALGLVKWLFVAVQLRLTGSSIPFRHGRLAATPREVTGLQAGDRVRVKTSREIERTLDAKNRNHGLSFDSEMLRYCGREMRVLKRVARIIDERTGRMRSIPNDCLILDGAICTAEYHLSCPRSIYPYWREIWLTKVEDDSSGAVP
jgi:hypothetical protein